MKRGPMPEFERNMAFGRLQRVKIIFPDKTEVTCDYKTTGVWSNGDLQGTLNNFAVFVPMVKRIHTSRVKRSLKRE